MFYALAEGKIDTEGLQFEHVLRDIQTLNEWAQDGEAGYYSHFPARLRVRAGQVRSARSRSQSGGRVRAESGHNIA